LTTGNFFWWPQGISAMTIEYDEKGKFYTDVVKKMPVPVTIQTATHLMHGLIHVRDGERLKNELERNEMFLAVTNAVIYGSEDKILYTVPFLAVQRAQIVWIMPVDEDTQKDMS
jgi:hypothetical protein